MLVFIVVADHGSQLASLLQSESAGRLWWSLSGPLFVCFVVGAVLLQVRSRRASHLALEDFARARGLTWKPHGVLDDEPSEAVGTLDGRPFRAGFVNTVSRNIGAGLTSDGSMGSRTEVKIHFEVKLELPEGVPIERARRRLPRSVPPEFRARFEQGTKVVDEVMLQLRDGAHLDDRALEKRARILKAMFDENPSASISDHTIRIVRPHRPFFPLTRAELDRLTNEVVQLANQLERP